MKRIKWTPILLSFPILTIGYALHLRYGGGWTPFSLLIIIGFILMMCFILIIDRSLVSSLKLRTIWIGEIILIIFGVIYFYFKDLI